MSSRWIHPVWLRMRELRVHDPIVRSFALCELSDPQAILVVDWRIPEAGRLKVCVPGEFLPRYEAALEGGAP